MSKQVKIVMEAHGRGKVFVDGQQIKGIKQVSFKGAVDSANEVTLTFNSENVEVDGVVDVTEIGSIDREFKKVA